MYFKHWHEFGGYHIQWERPRAGFLSQKATQIFEATNSPTHFPYHEILRHQLDWVELDELFEISRAREHIGFALVDLQAHLISNNPRLSKKISNFPKKRKMGTS